MSQLTLFNEDIENPLEVDHENEHCRSTYESATKQPHITDFFCSEGEFDANPKSLPIMGGRWKDGDYEKPQIHILQNGDSMKAICKKYNVSADLIQKTNLFNDIDDDLLAKRKFVVIPSIATFINHEIDIDYVKHWELIKNFCILFDEVSVDQADFYLAKANYNLAVAIENYQYELC